MAEKMLTVKQVATILGVLPETVRRWIKEGRFRAYRVGKRHIRIREADLETYLASSLATFLASREIKSEDFYYDPDNP